MACRPQRGAAHGLIDSMNHRIQKDFVVLDRKRVQLRPIIHHVGGLERPCSIHIRVNSKKDKDTCTAIILGDQCGSFIGAIVIQIAQRRQNQSQHGNEIIGAWGALLKFSIRQLHNLQSVGRAKLILRVTDLRDLFDIVVGVAGLECIHCPDRAQLEFDRQPSVEALQACIQLIR